MNEIREVYTTIEKYNPISGHYWTEQGKLIGFEVYGGKWCTTFHRKYPQALKEKDVRDSIDTKFPLTM